MSEAVGNGHTFSDAALEALRSVLMCIKVGPDDVLIADSRVFSPEHFRGFRKNDYSTPVLMIVPVEGRSLEEAIQVIPKKVLIELLEILTK
jgi:hypothetical protein